jgi:hypothetical protein
LKTAEKYAAFEKMLLQKFAPEQNIVSRSSALSIKLHCLKLASFENFAPEKLTSLKVVLSK